MNLFKYQEVIPSGNGRKEAEIIDVYLNLDTLFAVIGKKDGTMDLRFSDWHEAVRQEPIFSNSKKPQGSRNVRETINTTVTLDLVQSNVFREFIGEPPFVPKAQEVTLEGVSITKEEPVPQETY